MTLSSDSGTSSPFPSISTSLTCLSFRLLTLPTRSLINGSSSIVFISTVKLAATLPYMGSFAHPMHNFAAAGENDNFVIPFIKLIFLTIFMLLIRVFRRPDFEYEDKQKFLKII